MQSKSFLWSLKKVMGTPFSMNHSGQVGGISRDRGASWVTATSLNTPILRGVRVNIYSLPFNFGAGSLYVALAALELPETHLILPPECAGIKGMHHYTWPLSST